MDAKSRKVLNCLTKSGGEQELFDLSITVKMSEDAVQALLGGLREEGLVSCRRDAGGKEFWSVAEPKEQSAPPPNTESKAAGTGTGAGEAGQSGRRRGKATAGPNDRFDEFIVDPAATGAPTPTHPPTPAPAPIRAEPVIEDFELKPRKERASKEKAAEPDDAFETKPKAEKREKREQSVGPSDRFDEFAAKVTQKFSLPIPVAVGAAAAVVVIVILLIVIGGGGGKDKKAVAVAEGIKTELTMRLDLLEAKLNGDISKLREENKALSAEIRGLRAELKKAGLNAASEANKPQGGKKAKAR